MTFHKIHNDLLHTGAAQGQIPVIGTGNKLATALLDTGSAEGKIPLIGTGNKLPVSLLDVGNSANQLVQLDATGKLPAIDGSLLTNLPAPGGGTSAWQLLSSQIASNSAQIDFDNSLITNAYSRYVILLSNMVVVNDGQSINLKLSTDNGSSFENCRYHVGFSQSSGGGYLGSNAASASFVELIVNLGTATGSNGSATVHIDNPTNAAVHKTVGGNFAAKTSNGSSSGGSIGGSCDTLSAINFLRVYAGSGNILSGLVKLYGVL